MTKAKRAKRAKPEKPPDWRVEAVRVVRDAVASLNRTTRLIALLLALGVAVTTVAWCYQALTARPGSTVQISVSVTKR